MSSIHDQSLVARDSALTGLRFLLDGDNLRKLLADSPLGPKLNGHLRVAYLRYKPGMNCLARIDLENGFAYAKAFTRDASDKLGKFIDRAEASASLAGSTVQFSDLDMVVNLFPLDARLPSLARLVDIRTRNEFLQRIFKDDPDWRDATYSALNYKPERRFVAKLVRPDRQAAVLKFYSVKEFASLRRSRKRFTMPDGLRVPAWIGGSKNHRVMAYEWLPGVTLGSRLEAGHVEDAALAGQALARLHASKQSRLLQQTRRDLKSRLSSLGQTLRYLLPDLNDSASAVTRRLEEWVDRCEPGRCSIHGDFYDSQVIIQGRSVGLIDSDRMQFGDPGQDLGCFIAHLERRRLQGMLTGQRLASIRTALLDGYRAASPGGFEPHDLEIWTAFNLFQLSHDPFRDREDDWAGETASLLDRCVTLLDGQGW